MPRKLLPVLAVFLLLITGARAQDTLSRYRFFYVSGGYANNYKHPFQNYRTGVAMDAGLRAVRTGPNGWGVEYGVSYYQGWFYSFLIPSTVQTNAYYRRYTQTYLSVPLLARKLILRGSRHYYIALGPDFNLGLLEGRTDVDGNDEAVWIFPESAHRQPSLIGAQLNAGCDFTGAHSKHFRLGIVTRTGIIPFNASYSGRGSIPFMFGAIASFGFDPDRQAEKRNRRRAK